MPKIWERTIRSVASGIRRGEIGVRGIDGGFEVVLKAGWAWQVVPLESDGLGCITENATLVLDGTPRTIRKGDHYDCPAFGELVAACRAGTLEAVK